MPVDIPVVIFVLAAIGTVEATNPCVVVVPEEEVDGMQQTG
jgi:hypothetical protein